MSTATSRAQFRCIPRRPLLFAAALAVWGGSMAVAAADVRYVGPNGRDDVNGCLAPDRPCQTIAHAISRTIRGDEISLRAGTYLESGLVVPPGITISGAGQGKTIIDAGLRDRAFLVSAAATSGPFPMPVPTPAALVVEDLTITRGSPRDGKGGGAFLVLSGALELVRVELYRNFGGEGGGVNCPSGCAGLRVEQSALTENHASNGGAISTYSETLVENSTFSGNVADDPDEGKGGAIRCLYAALTVHDSELASNVAEDGGGGIDAEGCTTRIESDALVENWSNGGGGALYARYGGELIVTNATFSANTAKSAGAAIEWFDPVAVYVGNTTMVDNMGEDGVVTSDLFGELLTLTNSILTHPSRGAGVFYSFSISTPPSGSHNLIDADGTNFPPGFRDGAITPDTIGPLQDNGGPTRTHALRPGSNAIGAVAGGCFDPRTGNALNRDQRAVARPVGAAASCDIGAFEHR